MNLQSALDPQGVEAAGIAHIAFILFAGGGLIFLAVLILTALALSSTHRWLGSTRLVIAGGIVFPLVTLSALLLYTLPASPRIGSERPADVLVEIVGHQWWWRIEYLTAQGAPDFATANELHLPRGAVVELRLRSADVLHSFWVPSLAGKLDMIPGRENRLRMVADRLGTFRGQCAEYCGGPHAQMALLVRVEPPVEFAAWLEAQRKPQSAAGSRPEGRRLFLEYCASCHTVRGIGAKGELGPDLTHFAGRLSLGAGILPIDAATLPGWIAGSQHLKPGNLMPEFSLTNPEMRELVDYLRSLH